MKIINSTQIKHKSVNILKKFNVIKLVFLVFGFLYIINTPIVANPTQPIGKETKKMNDNIPYLNNATQSMDKFIKNPKQKNGFTLIENAASELDKVNLNAINNRQQFKQERYQWLILNFKIINIIDQYYQPNQNITFELKVLPPEIDGVSYPFPIDPKKIQDPKVRAEYEKKILENEQKQIDSQLQTVLERLNGSDPTLDKKMSYIETFKRKIPDYYAEYAEDKKDLKKYIDQIIVNPDRKIELYNFLGL